MSIRITRYLQALSAVSNFDRLDAETGLPASSPLASCGFARFTDGEASALMNPCVLNATVLSSRFRPRQQTVRSERHSNAVETATIYTHALLARCGLPIWTDNESNGKRLFSVSSLSDSLSLSLS